MISGTESKLNKILSVIVGLNMGGTEKMLINISRRLDLQIEQSVLSLNGNENRLVNQLPSHVHFEKINRNKGFDASVVKNIRKLLIRDEVDIILAFGLLELVYCKLAMLGIKKHIQVLLSIHSTGFVNFSQLIQRWLFARFIGRDDLVLAVCNAQVKYWHKFYQIPYKKFQVIYNGVDTDYFSRNGKTDLLDVRKQYSIPQESFVIIQVASLTPHKRHEDTIAALKYVTQTRPELSVFALFIGIGNQERESYLKGLAGQSNLSDRIFFCGMQSDVRPFLMSSDLFTLTSSTTETFSVAALEAMAMGLPVVLTDVAGAKEMVFEGVNGYLVMPYNPKSIAEGWLKILDNKNRFSPDKIREITINRFDINQCAQQYRNLLLAQNTPE